MGANFPAAHFSHSLDSDPENLPAWQSIGAEEPFSDTKEPAVARVQIVDPDIGAYEPGRQASQELAPAALIVPVAQDVHVVDPAGAKVPDWQSSHALAPVPL